MSTVNKSKHVYLSDLHFENKMWLNELNFFEDEIETYKNRLEELVKRYSNNEMLAQLESFQNRFILNKEVIDTYKHDIKLHDKQLSEFAEENKIAIDHQYFEENSEMKEKMTIFKSSFSDLKNEFYSYLSKWM